MNRSIESAIRTLKIESEAVARLADRIDGNFSNVVDTINKSEGRLIITGMGKSGVIGMKLAATFSSTGTAAFFLHPAEAIHGDLGMIRSQDVVLALSYSGETDEVLRIVPFLKEYSNTLIAMTGHLNSTLAKAADFHIDVKVKEEACPINLAPTSSTTATLAMGDALAIAVMELKKFQPDQFARYHPGGSLGRKLLTRVRDVMHGSNLPVVQTNSPIREVIQFITAGRLGMVIVERGEKQQTGIITDGDLRRAMEKAEENFFSLKAEDIMTAQAKIIVPDAKIREAEQLMKELKISTLIVKEGNELKGVIQVYDIQ